jgi:hypothetical protein
LKHFLLRIIFAALAAAALALALAACGGGGGDGDQTGRIVERLLTSGQEEGTKVRTFVGELPAGLPWEIPSYPGSTVLASFVMEQPEGSTYFIMLDSDDAPDQILQFYESALDEDPWQVEGTISSSQVMALQFSEVDDANVSGGLSVDNLAEGGSGIVVSVQELEEASTPEAKPFELGASRPLPSNFPSDVPLYPDSTVTDTTWLRSPGGVDFLVTFLTTHAPKDVNDFYRTEFTDRGFTVTDETGSGSALVLSFTNPAGDLTGTVTADTFGEDAAYTQVDIQLHVGSSQGGN